MAKVGRRANHFTPSSGDTVLGLIHQKDGRWRVLATGKRFTAASEGEAIARFRQLQKPDIIPVPSTVHTEIDGPVDANGMQWMRTLWIKPETHGDDFWPWLRELLTTQLQEVAQKTGLPGLAGLDLHSIPAGDIRLEAIIDAYKTRSESRQNTKRHVEAAIRRLMASTGATTVNGLTTPLLTRFRDEVVKGLRPSGAAAIFGQVKAAVSFARKIGLDAGQLDAVLGRMKVLYAPASDRPSSPHPMSPEDFRKLLSAADTQWRAILLLGINGALYAEDIAGLEWKDFDLDAGTYSGTRAKTSIIRVMALWPETVEALRKLPRKGQSPLLFTSQKGGRYMASSLYDSYKELRESVGVTTPFSGLRDAAYTIACEQCEDRVARVFAAHKAPGLMDNYVARRPEYVRCAAEAVKARFAPFPTSSLIASK